MLNRIDELMAACTTFAFETTLATRSYKAKILKAQQQGYNVVLLFFWLDNIELAKERVRTRVSEGGHNIPENVIERRYSAGIKNLFKIYLNIVDEFMIMDNSFGEPEIIAQKLGNSDIQIKNITKFDKLKAIL